MIEQLADTLARAQVAVTDACDLSILIVAAVVGWIFPTPQTIMRNGRDGRGPPPDGRP